MKLGLLQGLALGAAMKSREIQDLKQLLGETLGCIRGLSYMANKRVSFACQKSIMLVNKLGEILPRAIIEHQPRGRVTAEAVVGILGRLRLALNSLTHASPSTSR